MNFDTDWIFASIKEVVVIVLIFRCDNAFVYKRAVSFRDTYWIIEEVICMEFASK